MTDGEHIWYCALGDGARIGPISETELIALAKSGKLHLTDQVWRKAWPDWLPAESVPLLSSALSTQPPPLRSRPPERSYARTSVPTPIRFNRFIKFAGWVIMMLTMVGLIRLCGSQMTDMAKERQVPAPSADNGLLSPMNGSDLIRIVERQNEAHPTRISELLELTRLEAGPGLQITYHYRVLRDDLSKDMITHDIFQGLKRDVLTDKCPSLRALHKSGILVVVSYNASDGSNLFGFPITSEDCMQ